MSRRLYARWWGFEYVNDWNDAADLIRDMIKSERGDALLYEYFEKLATSLRFRMQAQWAPTLPLKRTERTTKPRPGVFAYLRNI